MNIKGQDMSFFNMLQYPNMEV